MAYKKLIKAYIFGVQGKNLLSTHSVFSILSISIGVAALIVVMSVMNGFRSEIISGIIGINGHINIEGSLNGIYDQGSILEQINSPSIKTIETSIQSDAIIISDFGILGAYARGLEDQERNKNEIINNLRFGSLDGSGVIIGVQLSRFLKKTIGDKITVVLPTNFNTIFGFTPSISTYQIDAIIETGIYDYDSGIIYIQKKNLANSIGLGENEINNIKITLEDTKQTELATKEIVKKLKNRPDLRIRNWIQSNDGFIKALETEKIVMSYILSIIIIVAAFGMISTTNSFVRDKKHCIAVLKSFGMPNYSIILIFTICGFCLGLIGTAFGIFLGTFIASHVDEIRSFLENIVGRQLINPVSYFLSHLPSKLEYKDIIKVSVLSLFISLISALLPSLRIIKNNPAEILRNL